MAGRLLESIRCQVGYKHGIPVRALHLGSCSHPGSVRVSCARSSARRAKSFQLILRESVFCVRLVFNVNAEFLDSKRVASASLSKDDVGVVLESG